MIFSAFLMTLWSSFYIRHTAALIQAYSEQCYSSCESSESRVSAAPGQVHLNADSQKTEVCDLFHTVPTNDYGLDIVFFPSVVDN